MIIFIFVLIVLYVGKGGFWEGKTVDQRGWFPQNAIKEISPGNFDNYILKFQETYLSLKEVITNKATTLDKVPSK